MTQTIKKICKSLRLAYVADIFKSVPFENKEQFLEQVFAKEFELRDEARAERMIKKAGFLNKKSLDSFEWNGKIQFPPQLDSNELCSLKFIERRENVILSGSPGTGKTHLATGLDCAACKKGFDVRFFRVSDLVNQLKRGWREGKLQSFRNKFKKADLIILDEMGYIPFSKEGAKLLFQLVTDWYVQKSLFITSNLEFSQWNRIFVDSRLTVALETK